MIGVYGVTGHTGRLVCAELARRGHSLRLAARRDEGLTALSRDYGAQVLVTGCEDESALARFAAGLAVLVNCAGPFGNTAPPLARAAIAAGTHYVDTTGDPPVVEELISDFDGLARRSGCVLAPAVGFFGALPSLLAFAAADGAEVEDVRTAYALEGWHMTPGSRAAAAALAGRRHVFSGGILVTETNAPSSVAWRFPGGAEAVPVLDGYPAPEVVLLAHRLASRSAKALMTMSTLDEIRSAPDQHEVDAAIRAQSRFVVTASVGRCGSWNSASASGYDIYGLSAALVAEMAERLLAAPAPGGVRAAFELLSPHEILPRLPGLSTTCLQPRS
jgi:hypothetical protein